MTWILFVLVAIGCVLNVMQRPLGFVFWIASNVGWILHCIAAEEWALVAQFGLLTAFAVWGLVAWTLQNRRVREAENKGEMKL